MKDVYSTYLFPNGMIATVGFDEQQIPPLQGRCTSGLVKEIFERSSDKTEFHGFEDFLKGKVLTQRITRADYCFEYFPGYDILLLEDLGHFTKKSLTNDMDKVVEDLKKNRPEWNWPKIKIAYKDSESKWDGVQILGDFFIVFFPIRTIDKQKAFDYLKSIAGNSTEQHIS
jgi:hypothetical protein